MHRITAITVLLAIGAAPAKAQIAAPGSACASARTYNYTPSGVLVCNGTVWQNLLSTPAGDPSASVAIGAGVLAGNAAEAGGDKGTRNIGIGYQALQSNVTGFSNTGIGYQALLLNSSGGYNSAFGISALSSNTAGSGNTAIGTSALLASTGSYNVAVGTNALFANTAASHNTALGYGAGMAVTTGSSNILLGENGNITAGSGNVLIGNSLSGTEPASNAQLDISDLVFGAIGSGKVGLGTSTYSGVGLTVNGNVWATSVMPIADDRLYSDMRTLRGSLQKITAMRGVSYQWRVPSERELGQDLVLQSDGQQFGMSAQEVEQVFPEAVETAQNGIKTLNYNALVGPMIEAIKALRYENQILMALLIPLYLCVLVLFFLRATAKRSTRPTTSGEGGDWHSGLRS